VTPRQYDMTSRRASAGETRRRILEATLELHTEKGIFGTSWQDIAIRADVAVGTVYRHFPSLAELVPACGELLFELTGPPSPEDAAAAIGDETDPVRRLERAASALFAFYERAGRHIDSDARERELPEVREWEEHLRATVAAFVREALAPRRLRPRQLQLVSALFDFRAYDALRTRGITATEAARELSALVGCHLGLGTSPGAGARARRGGAGSE
jgi:AcrR family transcriptional regulator